MALLKSDVVPYAQLAEALACLPEGETGLAPADALRLWQAWHREGCLQIGRVAELGPDGRRQTQALGISLWISPAAARALSQPDASSTPAHCTARLYRSALADPSWVLRADEITQAHDAGSLQLMVLHFWSAQDVSQPAFQPVFLQAQMLFRDLHQGFNVAALYQEVPQVQVPFLEAAGMQKLHGGPADDPGARAWMALERSQALARQGTTMAFLFLTPPRKLGLPPAVQRMLTLAVRQLTDEEIASQWGVSRDYIRKLWDQAYERMELQGVLDFGATPSEGQPAVRGRERRRTALEFMRANPHEMRPGLPTPRRTAADRD